MSQIVFITADDARHGFGIAGALQHTVVPAEAKETLLRVMTDPETGVIAIDERLLAGIEDKLFRELERRWFGILLVLPAPEKMQAEAEDYAMRLVRQAIGYHVRISG